MVLINGLTNSGEKFWKYTVPLESDTSYIFKYRSVSLMSVTPARIMISINGVDLGTRNLLSNTCYGACNTISGTPETTVRQ